MKETMAALTRIDSGYYQYGDYEIERFGDIWYIFARDGFCVADFLTLRECRSWLFEMESHDPNN